MPEVWKTARLQFCLDRWEADYEPDASEKVRVYHWLMDLATEDPRPPSAAPIVESQYNLWLGEVPGTTVNVLHGIVEDEHRLVFMTIETL